MKLELTVTSQKFENPIQFVHRRELVDYVLAEITASGGPDLIAGHLRALADSIDPNNVDYDVHEDGN